MDKDLSKIDNASLTLPSDARAIIVAALISISEPSFWAIYCKYFEIMLKDILFKSNL